MKIILKTIVGSQAHGLATPESDFDYRSVFINPTSEILSLNGDNKQTNWIEGQEDNTEWEIGHFLKLATKCNPTILEVFLAPLKMGTEVREQMGDSNSYALEISNEGEALRALFPYVWNSKYVHDSFTGYGWNQQKKFLDNKDGRASKYAAAYLRTLYQAYELLSTCTFTIRIIDTPVGETVKRWKFGEWTVGEVMQTCADWRDKVKAAYEKNPDKQTDIEEVNNFLLNVRKNNW